MRVTLISSDNYKALAKALKRLNTFQPMLDIFQHFGFF